MHRMRGICKLCEQAAELERSHILPAAAHRETKDAGRNVKAHLARQSFNRRNQTDFAEPLLCFMCEQKLSIFEGRAIAACKKAWVHRDDMAYRLPSEAVRPLVEFGYSVFWRASVSKVLDDYSLAHSIEDQLKAAFVAGEFPDPPTLPLSMSFLQVSGVTITNRILMTPWIEALAAGGKVTYFTVFGIVFRLHFPVSMPELKPDEFLRVRTRSGTIYPLQPWELDGIDNLFKLAVAQSKHPPSRLA